MVLEVQAQLNGYVDAMRFGTYLAEGCSKVIEFCIDGIQLANCITSKKKDLVLGIGFLEQFFDFMEDYNDRDGQLMKLKKNINQIAQAQLDKQSQYFQTSLTKCFQEVAVPLFDRITELQLERIDRTLKLVSRRLEQFRQERTFSNQFLAAKALEKYQYRVHQIIDFPDRCGISFSETQQDQIDKIKIIARSLEILINPSTESPIHLLYQLDFALFYPQSKENKKSTIEKLNDQIRHLPESIQNDIDKWVGQLANPPQEKNWGSVHRFDDLKRLREAICQSIFSQLKNLSWDPKVETLETSEFYDTLHSLALGPQDVDPQQWMDQELPYLVDIIKEFYCENTPTTPVNSDEELSSS